MGSRAEAGQYGDRTGNEPGVSVGCQYWNVERDEKLVPMQLPLHTANPHEESNSPYELSQATRVHTMASSSLVAIPICYTLPFQYPTHILPLGVTASRSDASEKPYQCGKCSREFSHISELKVHMRSHTGEKPYKCGECSRRFGMLCALKTHMRTHTGEKPYRCEKCGKQFSQQSSLNKHLTIHTGEKPFKCELCNMQFSRPGHLKSHMQTHTGAKPYRCERCRSQFSRLCSLNRHIARFHKGDPLKQARR
ncbi:zinc finger protein 239-like [Branchiostoma lanceolatum]|uniref:zinc finger protein 239-like n=1 Tax=Branchiostoma lanceolatum TaxID=7740 RepID=UPI0034538D96